MKWMNMETACKCTKCSRTLRGKTDSKKHMKCVHEACQHWLVCVRGESDSLSVGGSVLNSLFFKLTPCIYIYLINLVFS